MGGAGAGCAAGGGVGAMGFEGLEEKLFLGGEDAGLGF